MYEKYLQDEDRVEYFTESGDDRVVYRIHYGVEEPSAIERYKNWLMDLLLGITSTTGKDILNSQALMTILEMPNGHSSCTIDELTRAFSKLAYSADIVHEKNLSLQGEINLVGNHLINSTNTLYELGKEEQFYSNHIDDVEGIYNMRCKHNAEVITKRQYSFTPAVNYNRLLEKRPYSGQNNLRFK